MFTVLGAGFGVWVAHIPGIKERLALGDGRLGLALLGIIVGSIAAMPISAAFARRHGGRVVVVYGAFGACAVLPVLAVAPDFSALVVAAVAYGFAFGSIDVALNALASGLEREAGRPLMSTLHGFFSLGGLLGAAAAGVALDAGAPPIWTMGVAAAVFAAVVRLARGRLPAGRVASAPTTRRRRRPERRLLVLGGLALLGLLGEGAMGDWSAVYLRELGGGHALAAAGFGAYSLAMAAGRFGGDRVVAIVGPATCLRAGGALVIAGLLVGLSGPSAVAAIAGFGLVGLGLANGAPVLFGAAGRADGSGDAAGRIAVVAGLGYVGFLLGPPLIGWVADAVGLRLALLLLVGTGAASIAFAGAVGGPSPVASGRVEQEPAE